MDIFDKYAQFAGRHEQLLELGADPFAVRLDDIHSATEALIDGRPTILAGTNNYLGLTYDPACIAAAEEALRRYGTGHHGLAHRQRHLRPAHRARGGVRATTCGKRSCMVFSTGYQANLAMIAGLAGPRDVVLIDADLHASIYDACKLSGATIVRFRHNDAADLDRRLGRLGSDGECRLVIVEGMYSMLGDTAPLADFVEVKRRHGAWLLVDEAHSFGCFGEHGRGLAEEQGVEADIDFVVGTFSKSLGAIGGFGASNHPSFDLLRLCARPYMFTASPSPASMASVHAALRRIEADPGLRDAALGQFPPPPCRPDQRLACALLGPEPGDRRADARRGDGGKSLEPAARARRLRQLGAAARNAQQPLPAALQRLRRAYAATRSTRSSTASLRS